MSYVVWSVSPDVMRSDKLVGQEKLLWHYFWNECGRRAGPLTISPEQCARGLGLDVGAIHVAAMKLADVGLLIPMEEPNGIAAVGIAPPETDVFSRAESHWLRWKVPSIVLSRNDLDSHAKLVYLYLWNKAGGRPVKMRFTTKEIAGFFNVPESSI